jgi:hypothetical protein
MRSLKTFCVGVPAVLVAFVAAAKTIRRSKGSQSGSTSPIPFATAGLTLERRTLLLLPGS